MNEELFKRAYETQERLTALQPEHPLAQKKYMSNAQKDCYAIRIDPDFIIKYPQNGLDSQLKAFIGDLEKAIEQASVQEKPTQPVGQ